MSAAIASQPPLTCSYDEDFYAWAFTTAALLRQRRFADIDIEHLAEEIEDMGKRDRRALESHIHNILLHLLKWRYQSEKRTTSWRQSIRNGRIEMQKLLRDSPSLAGQVAQILEDEYPAARDDVIDETGLSNDTIPPQCPFTSEQVLNAKFWTDT
ncbi:MAG: DUF29 domain-containing protein [Deltaproteobacteria bacterium]|nr:DUF29 domain-containing protein [Deltaproteobacteria bacterium]